VVVDIYTIRPGINDGGCIVGGNCNNSFVHASELIPGSVTFMGELGIELDHRWELDELIILDASMKQINWGLSIIPLVI
jgi:hypothetical protein